MSVKSRSSRPDALEQPAEVAPFSEPLDELWAALAYIDLRVQAGVARARAQGLDPDDEFRGLYISEAQVDALLAETAPLWFRGNGRSVSGAEWATTVAQARAHWQHRTAASRAAGKTMPLDSLVVLFELSPEETDILLLALAPEIDPRYERLFAYLQDDVTRKRPTVDLLLNLLTTSFTEKVQLRRCLSGSGRLRRSRLLICFADANQREPTLLSHFVRPAAPLVEHLLGHPGLDDRLEGSAVLSFPADVMATPRLSDELVRRLAAAAGDTPPPLFAFQGGYGAGKELAAGYIAQTLDRPLIRVDLALLADSAAGLLEGLRLLLRDGRLLQAALYLFGWDGLLQDGRPPDGVLRLLLAYPGPVIVAGEMAWQPTGSRRARPILHISFGDVDYEHRLRVWQDHLDDAGLPLPQLANQFQFSPGQIDDAVATAHDLARGRQAPLDGADLFAASRAHSNQKLMSLATKIQPRYRWADIVLPADTVTQLQEMVNTVRQRPTVYGRWGFGRKVALGKGLNALFAGESGTGKTMAADIIAGELGQDLYKIDLSMLVSKYIGETEKNLNRIFTEAATSNAILFFDEADAIFGKRSEVKDSHDRYANIEISYLLQRMETYDGVVILATNMRANLDEAFIRRLHFIIEFPFPEVSDREVIWRVNFPVETPLADDVDLAWLASSFRLAGGNIRNIIMAAAFLAAQAGRPVGLAHLLHATRREYQKIGRLIDERKFTPPAL